MQTRRNNTASANLPGHSGTEEPAASDIEPVFGSVNGMDDYKMRKDAILRSYILSIRVIYK